MLKMKRHEKIKLIIIFFLTVLIMVLFYMYVSSGDSPSSENKFSQNINQFSKGKIAKDIDSIISTFGIKNEWKRYNSVREKDSKNENAQFFITGEVLIPADLPTIDLNYEISDYLRRIGFDAKVMEDPKSKNISMNIFSLKDSTGKQVGNLKFVYSDSVKRNAAEVCIVLDSLDSYSLADVEKILGASQKFSVFLPLRNDKADYQSKIIDMNKDYLIKFTIGSEDDITADFKSDMKENVWKSKVKSVYMNFPQITGIVLSYKKEYEDFNNEVREEFLKNNINIFNDTLFIQYKRGADKIYSLFNDIISKSNSGKKFLFYNVNFSPSEFSEYDKDVYVMKKLGYKFLDFKEMMKRVNKTER